MDNRTPRERFDCKYSVNLLTGCWEWTASRFVSGYGQFWHNGSNRGAHRVSYELHVGPIPEGLEIDHLCRVRHCVNPTHLEAVTHRINVLRGVSPGARNALKRQCARGHELTPANTQRRKHGRGCRACHRADVAASSRKRRANASKPVS